MPSKVEEIKIKSQEDVHAVVTLLVGASMMLVPYQYKMTKEDVDRIFIPLENIAIRHSDTGSINPDFVDFYLFAIGVVLYAQRTKLVQSTFGNGRLKIRTRRTNKPEPNFPQNPAANPIVQPRPKASSPTGTGTQYAFSDANSALADLYESAQLNE